MGVTLLIALNYNRITRDLEVKSAPEADRLEFSV